MKAKIRDADILRAVRPLDVLAYLRSRGWKEVQKLERGAFWIKEKESTSYEILLPFETNGPGFAQRISEVLSVLEEDEERSQLEIVEDLSFANADVIRPRLQGAAEDGTISLDHGRDAYEQARALMLAAACAAVAPREVYSKRKPDQAMNYLSHARFGVSRRGSYILTIISPVSPKLKIEPSLFNGDYAEEPFERRTVRVLAQALDQISVAARETAATGDFAPMKKAAQRGVSANLCDALIALHECSNENGVEFTFSWAPSRGVPEDIKSKAFISPDIVPILIETARMFRETGVMEGAAILGTVHKLEHQKREQGRVTIKGSVDGIQRTVITELAGADHSKAVRSYKERIPIVAAGELVKEGKSWILKNPHDISLIEQEGF